MKKLYFIGIALAAVSLMSCHHEIQNEEQIIDEDQVEMAPNETEELPLYKVENGQIIPQHDRPLIVDFYATWCPPCKKLSPIFKELAEEFKGRIDCVSIDVDQEYDLAKSYNVNSIPTLVFFNKDGQIQTTVTGFRDKDQLLAIINSAYGF